MQSAGEVSGSDSSIGMIHAGIRCAGSVVRDPEPGAGCVCGIRIRKSSSRLAILRRSLESGGFHLGEFARHAVVDSVLFPASKGFLDALRQRGDAQAATFRRPVCRLSLQKGQLEFLPKRIHDRENEERLSHRYPVSCDRHGRLRVELEALRRSMVECVLHALDRCWRSSGRVLRCGCRSTSDAQQHRWKGKSERRGSQVSHRHLDGMVADVV